MVENPPQPSGNNRSDINWQCHDLSRFSSRFSYTYFKKPYLCIKKRRGNKQLRTPHIQFSSTAIPHQRCVKILEPSDSYWSNPYLCVPRNIWYQFTWKHQGVSGKDKKRCLKWKMPKGKNENWCDNYLCAQEKSDGKGLVVFTAYSTLLRLFHCQHTIKVAGLYPQWYTKNY